MTRLPLRDSLMRDAEASGALALGDLPEWDLTDLYPSPDAPELSRDLERLEKACASFAADYEGKLAGLTPAEMLDVRDPWGTRMTIRKA